MINYYDSLKQVNFVFDALDNIPILYPKRLTKEVLNRLIQVLMLETYFNQILRCYLLAVFVQEFSGF